MARDTRGPMPPETDDLRRVSLDPPHWRQGRRLLVAQAAALGLLGVVGLIGVVARPGDDGWRLLGVPLTPALSVVLLGIAVAAALSMTHRRAAQVFTLAVSVAAVAVVVFCAVAVVHHEPGPLGFTAPAILLWAIVFCYNLGSAMWLLPDQVQGPDWIPRRRSRGPADSARTSAGRVGS